jgi:hypothetical protein
MSQSGVKAGADDCANRCYFLILRVSNPAASASQKRTAGPARR